jgi:hypothetical protein
MSFIRSVLGFAILPGALTPAPYADAQVIAIAPGEFSIAGYPVNCGPLPTIITSQIPDAAINNGQAILINPAVVGFLRPVLQLFVYAHECGHAVVGSNEVAADCWAIRTGRDQGWFPPQSFQLLIQMFQGNPGDINHPPGPARIAAMMQCYQAP